MSDRNRTPSSWALASPAEATAGVAVDGQIVALLILWAVVKDQDVPAGQTYWDWDGRTQAGDLAGNGIYFIQIISGDDLQIKRVIVLKR